MTIAAEAASNTSDFWYVGSAKEPLLRLNTKVRYQATIAIFEKT